MAKQPFDPFTADIRKRLLKEFESRPILDLPPTEVENGCGVYALYYNGSLELYKPISGTNKPIYVGKAIAPGGRKGSGRGITGSYVISRLKEHSRSINSATNLNLEDFTCRWLSIVESFVSASEVMLIDTYLPIWNRAMSGFGIHDPGKGRYQQARSDWDMLHPGRRWAERMPEGNSPQKIKANIKAFYKSL